MVNKQKLQKLLDKLNFLIDINETAVDISKIEEQLGALVPFQLYCEPGHENNKFLWKYYINSNTPGSSNYSRIAALQNELKYYLS